MPQAGRARVYVAISTLRRLGLAETLMRGDDGYHLTHVRRSTLDGSEDASPRR